MTWHDLFADGEVLGALVTVGFIVGSLFLAPHLEKWWEKRKTPRSTQGE